MNEPSEVSQRVRQQYEDAPFPPVSAFPVRSEVDRVWLYSFPEVYYHAFGQWRDPARARLLDAGCGTGMGVQQIRHLAPGAEVHACDLSNASLRVAGQRIEALNQGPVSFHQMDLLDLSALPGTFDAIFCSGVVHHTGDPVLALRQLKSKLKPDGVLYLMLYSRFGRRPTMLMRRVLQLLEADVPLGRQLFAALPKDHFLARWEYETKGSHNLTHREWFIDTYLNAQEKNYSIGEVFSDLGEAGLRFVRFAHPQWWELQNRLQAPPEIVRRFAALPEQQRYELMENLFSDQEEYYFLATHSEYQPAEPVRDPARWTAIRSSFARNRGLQADGGSLWQGYYGMGLSVDAYFEALVEGCDGRQSVRDMCAAWNRRHPQDPPELSQAVLFQMERQGVLFFKEIP
ncbi:MAG: methyltransferase domain-containing protein [Candidatus Eremiobacteraeota bacterium]|nr:methyltransferase domain-containing protein [Candidatus Eremiobacteraeota bacterium]MCW5872441.1 methyltransferase domain-containing protein [Candidatus Eremiobacteraeota bacterium]